MLPCLTAVAGPGKAYCSDNVREQVLTNHVSVQYVLAKFFTFCYTYTP